MGSESEKNAILKCLLSYRQEEEALHKTLDGNPADVNEYAKLEKRVNELLRNFDSAFWNARLESLLGEL